MIKNKFLRFLLIINGIIIPIVMGLFLYLILRENPFDNPRNDYNDSFELEETKFVLAYSYPKKIGNSNTYFSSIYKQDEIGTLLGDNYLDDINSTIPYNTVNIVFLDKKLNIKNKIFDNNDNLIKAISLPHENPLGFEKHEFIKKISYLIIDQDSDKNGLIDSNDFSKIYFSDIDGSNFHIVLDKNVIKYSLINENKDLLISYLENDSVKYGILNIDSENFTEAFGLNEELEKSVKN